MSFASLVVLLEEFGRGRFGDDELENIIPAVFHLPAGANIAQMFFRGRSYVLITYSMISFSLACRSERQIPSAACC